MQKNTFLNILLFLFLSYSSQTFSLNLKHGNNENYLTFTGMTQTVSVASDQEVSVTILVNCYGNSPDPVNLLVTPCVFDNGYKSYSTNNGTILYPGQNTTITFKFKKVITQASTFNYKFIKSINDSCTNESNLIKITVNYLFTPPPTCVLSEPTTVSVSNLTTSQATISWNNTIGNNGYKVSWHVYGSTSGDFMATNINESTITLGNLQSAKTYIYQIATRCSNGIYSNKVATGSFETQACTPPIPVPNEVTNITDYSATISWPMVTGYLKYQVIYKKSTDTKWTYLPTSSTNLVLSNLNWNTEYEYRVATKCGVDDNYGNYSTIKSFTTSSPSIIFPEDILIATVNTAGTVHLNYPTGRKSELPYSSTIRKIDMNSSKSIIAVTDSNSPIYYNGSEWIDYTIPGTPIWDVSISKPFKFKTYNQPETIFALAYNRSVYYKILGGLWTKLTPVITSGPWSNEIKSIEAHSFYSFNLLDTEGNCVRCDRVFGMESNSNVNCRPVSIDTEGIGASHEDYIYEEATGNTKSSTSALYTTKSDNTITYKYNLSDIESVALQKPSQEPNSCTKCLIDGYLSSYGVPGSLVYLPNSTGYFYNGTNWITVAENINDISIGKYEGFVGTPIAKIAQQKDISGNNNPEIVSYPNPVDSNLNIDLHNLPDSTYIKMMLSDINSANIIFEEEITNSKKFKLDVSKFKSGIYILKILVNENVYTKKIIIKH